MKTPGSGRFALVLTGLFLIALGIRVLALYEEGQDLVFTKYTSAAEQIAEGRLEGARVLDFSPLYLEFHRVAYELGGAGFDVLRVFQCGVGALSCVLLALIGATFLGRFWGAVSGLLMALHRDLIIYDQMFEPEGLLIALILLSAFSALTIRRAIIGGPLAGLFAGLAIATRPTAWLLVICIPLFALHRKAPHSKPFVRALGFFVLILSVQAGFKVRNESFGRVESMSPWQVFYTGNNPMASGLWRPDFLVKDLERHSAYTSPDFAHQVFRNVALAAGADPDNPDVYWRDLATNYLRLDPIHSAKHIGSKALSLGQPVTSFDFTQAARLSEALESWPLVPAGFLFVIGLVGMLVRLRSLWPVLFTVVAFGAVFCAFFVSERYRVLLAPWACLGAGALGSIWFSSKPHWVRAGLAVVLTVAGVLLVSLPLPPGHYASHNAEALRKVTASMTRAEKHIDDYDALAAREAVREAFYALPWAATTFPVARAPFPRTEFAQELTDRATREYDSSPTVWNLSLIHISEHTRPY